MGEVIDMEDESLGERPVLPRENFGSERLQK